MRIKRQANMGDTVVFTTSFLIWRRKLLRCLYQLTCTNGWIMIRDLCTELNISLNTGNNGGNVGVSRFPSGVSQMLTKEHRKHYMQVCQDLLSRKAEDLNFPTQIREEDNISLVK